MPRAEIGEGDTVLAYDETVGEFSEYIITATMQYDDAVIVMLILTPSLDGAK